jgi:hypothetical protein
MLALVKSNLREGVRIVAGRVLFSGLAALK